VIVSMVGQAMTLLRSQHPGLGPGGSMGCTLSGVYSACTAGTLFSGGLGW
jgi:hypothetical protein